MRFFKFKRPLSPSRLSLASFMLSAFLRAGITTLDAVSAAAGSLRGRAARAFASAAHDIGAGRSLSDSLMRTGAFPEIFIESVRAGEESGRLARVLYSLGTHYSKRSHALGALHAAMLYPALLVALSVIVVIIVMTQLMPSVISLLEAAGAPLPPSTCVLVGIYDLVTAHWQGIVPALAAVYIVLGVAVNTPAGAHAVSHLKRSIPFVGSAAAYAAAARFTETLRMLLTSGVPFPRAVSLAGRASGDCLIIRETEKVASLAEAGYDAGELLRGCRSLPAAVRYAVASGIENGLPGALSAAEELAFCAADASARRLLAVSEPLAVIIAGIFVAFIVISIYAPIFSVYEFVDML